MKDATNTTTPAWTKDESATKETWRKVIQPLDIEGYASQYPAGDSFGGKWNWQTMRLGCRAGGITETLEEAQAESDRHLAMSDEDFAAIIVPELTAELATINRKLKALGAQLPTASQPLYEAGYQDGYAAAKRLVMDALSCPPPHQQSTTI